MDLRRQDRGVALPTVLILILVLMLVCGGVFFYISENTNTIVRTKTSYGAMNIAEAGYNRYLWHLNADPRYFEKSPSELPADAMVPNKTLEIRDGDVKGYVYFTVTPPTTTNPDLQIYMTGWVPEDPNNKKTIHARINKRVFTQCVYLSAYEQTPEGTEVWWGNSQTVSGPVHTNGHLNIDGSPVFNGPLTYTTRFSAASAWHPWTGSSAPSCPTGYPRQVSQFTFPASNSQLVYWAGNDYTFDGTTCICFTATGIKVRNKGVVGVQVYDYPNKGVIYVKGDVNRAKFDPSVADVFVSGEVYKSVTVVSDRDIYITGYDPTEPTFSSAAWTGGLTYTGGYSTTNPDANKRMLGLVAGRNIWILHNGWPGSGDTTTDVAPDNINIYSALFALNGCFGFEGTGSGARKGTITLRGAIVQCFRGIVLDNNSHCGYNKDYAHDPRMSVQTPPHFIDPVNEGWQVVGWQEWPTPSGIPNYPN
ncbi:MAG: hypothetical protein ACM3PP_08110 [Candidatus Saccharibacteria bacterium]